jgi:hypothetical protein
MELHATYYWDHFQYVISYVKKHYSEILSEEEFTFIQQYEALSTPAQCLYLRLSSRSPTWFRVDKLNYSEIPTIEIACHVLESTAFLHFLRPDSDDSINSLLSIFTRKECSELALSISSDYRIPTAYSKAEAIDYLTQKLSCKDLLEALITRFGPLVRPMQTEVFEFIQFLFFGSTSRDMTDFVVRDLGHRQFMEVAEDELIPFFEDRKEAIQKWKISRWRQKLRDLSKQDSVNELALDWETTIWPMADELTDKTMGAFERSLFELARRFEREIKIDAALALYERSLMPNSLERRIRILHKLNRKIEALDWARVGLEITINPQELHFFEDYLAKQDSNTSIKRVTKTLKSAEKVTIPIEFQGNVEQGVIEYFKSQGFEAYFTENQLWKNLIGLIAWDLIFDLSKQSFHHPFQYAPSAFHSEEFSIATLAEFEMRLAILDDFSSCMAYLKGISEAQQGILNPYVNWFSLDLNLLEAFIQRVPIDSLKNICLHFWKNASTHAKGFPDLFVFRGKEYAFIEVKSPNDHLSAIQHDWHQFFREQSVEIKLLRVVWN